mmetsp:Transcript_3962/g.9991  ORF Transcript_3962/g.9991 Transcript_3962/m.9991 type:complete len:323 (+) Transcript_3962:134-1102(+)
MASVPQLRKRQRPAEGAQGNAALDQPGGFEVPSSAESVKELERSPTISFHALRRARTTVEDFVKSYFFYHELHVPEDFFKYFDILTFVEATIYQMDEINEARCHDGASEDSALPGEPQLRAVLASQGLMDKRLKAELDAGLEYWRQERRLCKAMRARSRLQACRRMMGRSIEEEGCTFTLEEVHACSLSKSFDYRVLNLLLYRLTGREYDEALLEFLRVDEHLVDINDDLVDYEEDIFANSFNIFRAYVHLFGRRAELELVKRISTWEARHSELLQRLPARIQARVKARQAEAMREAGEGAERWAFPQPVLDEQHYLNLHKK